MKERKKRENINNCQLKMPNIYSTEKGGDENFGAEIYYMREGGKISWQ